MRNTADGNMQLRSGADLGTTGPFTNDGSLSLSAGSRLSVGGRYRQDFNAGLFTQVGPTGHGRIDAAGRSHVAGVMVIRRIDDYRPPVGARFAIVTSDRVGGPGFDTVRGRTFGNKRFVVENVGTDKLRLRVVGRG